MELQGFQRHYEILGIIGVYFLQELTLHQYWEFHEVLWREFADLIKQGTSEGSRALYGLRTYEISNLMNQETSRGF